MSADLDDLFTTLSRDADAVPLTEATSVRRLGERRKRARAAVAGAAALCVVAAGGATWLTRPDTDENRNGPPVTAERSTPASSLPAVGAAVTFGGTARFAFTGIAGERVYAGWHEQDGTIKTVGADLATGRPAWPARALGRFDDFGGTVALPQAIMTSVEHNDGTEPDRTMFMLDPATGAQRWTLPFDVADDMVHYADRLVVQNQATGVTKAFDWVTGRVLWERPAGADRPVRTLGMYVPADRERAGQGTFPVDFSDRRLIQLTASGKVVVRDSATGDPQQTLAGPVPNGRPVAYDGRLYAVDGADAEDPATRYRITTVDVAGSGDPRVVYTGPAGRRFEDLTLCGKDSVCLIDSAQESLAQVVSVDVTTGREAWRRPAPEHLATLSARGDRLLVTGRSTQGSTPEDMTMKQSSLLYDRDGKQLLRDQDQGAMVTWVGPGTLLTVPPPQIPTGTGEQVRPVSRDVVKVSAKNGSRKVLGSVPEGPGYCSATGERLACPTATGLQLFDLKD